MFRSILSLITELVTYTVAAAAASALIGALGFGVGQAAGLEDATANAAGWAACITSFAFFAITGRPMRASSPAFHGLISQGRHRGTMPHFSTAIHHPLSNTKGENHG